MNETFPKNSIEHPTDAEIIAGLESKESALVEKAVSFFEGLDGEKIKEKAASMLLALSLFAGASSAFAGEQGADSIALPSMGEETIMQVTQKDTIKNDIAPGFSWNKIEKRIEFSFSEKSENNREYIAESIDSRVYDAVHDSSFFKGLDNGRWEGNFFASPENKAYAAVYSAIRNSQNSEEFFTNFATETRGLQDKQKFLGIQKLGEYFGYAYDYDMEASGEHVTVSDDAMFDAVKDKMLWQHKDLTAGTCGNIHKYLMDAAQSAGLKAFMQSGSASWGGGHVWMGAIVENEGKNEIVFLDYGTVIPTGTLNYRDALGIAERYHKSVTIFNNYVGDENGILFPVKSRATEELEKVVGIDGSDTRLNENLKKGGVEKGEGGLEISISPESKKIKLNSGMIGVFFTDISATHFEDSSGSPYQSLSGMDALSGNVGLRGENLGVKAGLTVLNMDIKDIYSGSTSSKEVIGTFLADYADNKQLTKSEYGEFRLNWGATFEGALKAPKDSAMQDINKLLGGGIPDDPFAEMKGDFSLGGRLIYLDPENTKRFYIDASEEFRGQSDDFQNQNIIVKKVAKNLALGVDLIAYEGSVLNMEAKISHNDWGNSFAVKGELSGNEKVTGYVSYEKETSNYQRYIPSSEKVNSEVTMHYSPKCAVSFISSMGTEQYEGAESSEVTNVEAKLILWW